MLSHKSIWPLVAFYLLVYAIHSPVDTCSVHVCSIEYGDDVVGQQQALKAKSLHKSATATGIAVTVRQLIRSRDKYCSLMTAYANCMNSMAKPCAANLEFHTVSTLLRNWIASDCSGRELEWQFESDEQSTPLQVTTIAPKLVPRRRKDRRRNQRKQETQNSDRQSRKDKYWQTSASTSAIDSIDGNANGVLKVLICLPLIVTCKLTSYF